ncbi:uncharacterized protein A4U43_C01F14660 [Asparagus officinalis]|uniref:Uncharacterized protein n=1 Tax=Asparagus officinalis TaxID=4686 RepID=A0A5P1FU08_ASPOF|nr:uncharacterized protein A4U43_C01F14660 [Asparagus officinalis]
MEKILGLLTVTLTWDRFCAIQPEQPKRLIERPSFQPEVFLSQELGESNKFYYDEKLKRWVEEGAEPPAEELALPPPSMTTVFQNGISDYNSAFKYQCSTGSGGSEAKPSGIPPISLEANLRTPPIPPSQN